MNNSPQLPKVVKGRPSTITLHNIYNHIELLQKRREERDVRFQKELETMLDNKFASLEDKIKKQIDNKTKMFVNKLESR